MKDERTTVLLVPLLSLVLATVFDFWKRKIPDSIPVAFMLTRGLP